MGLLGTAEQRAGCAVELCVSFCRFAEQTAVVVAGARKSVSCGTLPLLGQATNPSLKDASIRNGTNQRDSNS